MKRNPTPSTTTHHVRNACDDEQSSGKKCTHILASSQVSQLTARTTTTNDDIHSLFFWVDLPSELASSSFSRNWFSFSYSVRFANAFALKFTTLPLNLMRKYFFLSSFSHSLVVWMRKHGDASRDLHFPATRRKSNAHSTHSHAQHGCTEANDKLQMRCDK